jgi:hypothetical protein
MCGSKAERRGGTVKVIFSEVHQVPEGPLTVGHAGGRVDVDASPDETLVHARQCAEFVVPLHQQRVVGTVELQMRCASLGYQLAWVLREKCELRKVRPIRDGSEGKQIDAQSRDLLQHAVRGTQVVPHVGVIVVPPKTPIWLPRLMLLAAVGTLLADDVRLGFFPPDPPKPYSITHCPAT